MKPVQRFEWSEQFFLHILTSNWPDFLSPYFVRAFQNINGLFDVNSFVILEAIELNLFLTTKIEM